MLVYVYMFLVVMVGGQFLVHSNGYLAYPLNENYTMDPFVFQMEVLAVEQENGAVQYLT